MLSLVSRCVRPLVAPVRCIYTIDRGWKPRVDLTQLQDDITSVRENTARRGLTVDLDRVIAEYKKYLVLRKELEDLKQLNRDLTAEAKKIEDPAEKKAFAANKTRPLRKKIEGAEGRVGIADTIYRQRSSSIPNVTSPHSPVGGYDQARLLEHIGERPVFHFQPAGHRSLCERHGVLKVASNGLLGSPNTAYLRGVGALLQVALSNYVLQALVAKGLEAVRPPDALRTQVTKAFGRCSPGEYDLHSMHGGTGTALTDLVLSDSGTKQLAAMFACSGRYPYRLPQKSACLTHCFRKALPAAADLFSQSQYSTVEMFGVVGPNLEASEAMLSEFTQLQRGILESLGLHARVLEMPTEELFYSAYRKINTEVWMPSCKRYCSVGTTAANHTDFLARRFQIYVGRFFPHRHEISEREFCHTVSGTVMSIPSVICAVLEAHQSEDGSVRVPECLRPFLGGQSVLVPPETNASNDSP